MLGDQIASAWPVPLLHAGWLLISVGAGLILASAWALFTRGGRIGLPFDPPRALVVSGPYGWVRNPIYLGAFVELLGVALVLEWPAGLLVAVAFLLLAHAYVVFREEPEVERRFGQSYVEYRRAVPRWLPRRPGRK